MSLKVQLAALLVFGLESNAIFTKDDSCDLQIDSKHGNMGIIDKQVPEMCNNGSFEWKHPAGTTFLHFTDPYKQTMAVCVKDHVNGNIFTVRDVTEGYGFPSIIGRKASCTMHHSGHVTLQIDAPSQSSIEGSLIYEVFTYMY